MIEPCGWRWRILPGLVESRCGAVALGRTYLLPPLSSGGASMVPPWLRFHIPLIEPDRQISRTRLSLPAGAIAGWGLHPLESAAFAQRTPISDIALRNIHKVGPLTLVSG
jgi:hypothetical protein